MEQGKSCNTTNDKFIITNDYCLIGTYDSLEKSHKLRKLANAKYRNKGKIYRFRESV